METSELRGEEYLYTKVSAQGDIVGFSGEEITSGSAALLHHLALLAIKIRSERRQIKFGEKGSLQHRVNAMYGAKLGLLHLMVQHPSIADSFHFLIIEIRLERSV